MKKLFIINGINSELCQLFLKKIISKNEVIGFYNKKYDGITSKKIILTNNIKLNNNIKKKLSNSKKIVFINFAALRDEKILINKTSKTVDDTLKSNIISSIYILKAVIPFMLKQNYGRIIFLSSKTAENGSPGNIIYSFSKAGLIGISNTISKEYSKFNVTSNVISLGYFNTKMWKTLNENTKEKLLKNTLYGKLGKPEVIFDTIKLLIKHPFINMSKIDLDGGHL